MSSASQRHNHCIEPYIQRFSPLLGCFCKYFSQNSRESRLTSSQYSKYLTKVHHGSSSELRSTNIILRTFFYKLFFFGIEFWRILRYRRVKMMGRPAVFCSIFNDLTWKPERHHADFQPHVYQFYR